MCRELSTDPALILTDRSAKNAHASLLCVPVCLCRGQTLSQAITVVPVTEAKRVTLNHLNLLLGYFQLPKDLFRDELAQCSASLLAAAPQQGECKKRAEEAVSFVLECLQDESWARGL